MKTIILNVELTKPKNIADKNISTEEGNASNDESFKEIHKRLKSKKVDIPLEFIQGSTFWETTDNPAGASSLIKNGDDMNDKKYGRGFNVHISLKDVDEKPEYKKRVISMDFMDRKRLNKFLESDK